jgi:isopenicillin N synthase-like dioxygenase
VIDVGKRFFDSPQEEKDKIALKDPDGARGEGGWASYTSRLGAGSSFAVVSRVIPGYQKLKQNVTQGRADYHEGLDFYAPSPYPPGTGSGLPLR